MRRPWAGIGAGWDLLGQAAKALAEMIRRALAG